MLQLRSDSFMRRILKSFSQLSADELFAIYKLRVAVFVVEQKCAYQEVDEVDKASYHLWYEDEDGIEAYLRIIPAGLTRKEVSLGRVIAVKRLCGLGTKIVSDAISFAKKRIKSKRNCYRGSDLCEVAL